MRDSAHYLRTAEGWLYLAAILDGWSRRVVGWACAPTLHASLVLAALHNALERRQPPKELLHHSDRGNQYVDDDYITGAHQPGDQRNDDEQRHQRPGQFKRGGSSRGERRPGQETVQPSNGRRQRRHDRQG